jgi:acyl-CoA synthetase (NDP forming)
VQTETLDELVETMEIYSNATTNLQNNEVAVIEISGGGCSSYVDSIADSGLELAEFSADLKKELRSYIPDHIGRVGNPIDLGGIGGWSSDAMADIYPDLLELLDEMSESGTVISRINPPESAESEAKIQRLRETSTRNNISDKQFVIASRTSRCASREWIERVHNQNLPFLQGYDKSVRTIDNYSTFYLPDEDTE